ncbi:transport Sec61 subunit beta [Micractinium conductrix]|uniref:Transport Sec61 subunit beta n=1 Tax=Micractinium conductrix TaxID=554055 RepID=A0A2P6VCX2_9CHLO|nr:transport Sec61 subunit beta [Micractinium conductrix]|eukprot:PSC71932.1 transport Sec61 subunit beta [Micractinium conductrix]
MAGTLAKRPSSSGEGAVTRRRSSAASGGRGKGSSYFYTEDSAAIKLSPQAVIVSAIGFIVCVFILHIFGKLRS